MSVFTAEGVFVTSFGGRGEESGQFKFPCGIAVDDSGTVYVCDTGNQRVQVFNFYVDVNIKKHSLFVTWKNMVWKPLAAHTAPIKGTSYEYFYFTCFGGVFFSSCSVAATFQNNG